MIKTLETGDRTSCFAQVRHVEIDRGFTLIELMVVMAIMVVLVASMPLALNRMLPGYRFRAATEQLMSELKQARVHALTQGQVVAISCKGSSYSIQSLQESGRPERVIRMPVKTTITCSALSGGRTVDRLSLFPDGGAEGGVLSLTDGRRMSRLELSALTGRVRSIG